MHFGWHFFRILNAVYVLQDESGSMPACNYKKIRGEGVL